MLTATLFVVALLLAAAVVVIAMTNVGQSEAGTLPADEYEIFFIEGMPCVRVPRIDGISCDWSLWHGRQ
ncbi:MAG: hypothetical protein OES12_00275 [Anaerolineae bacterium]|nr:hypothetical protein [Anaerolineae bacterium]